MVKDFKELEIWANGEEIALQVYQLTQRFPRSEIFGLVSQMRKAAVSVPSNISEGFNRAHNKEFRQFLFIALGSLAELETQTNIATRLNYLGQNECSALISSITKEARMIRAMIRSLGIDKFKASSHPNQILEPSTQNPK